MNFILRSFSNREIAVFAWIGLIILILLIKKDVRKSMGGVIKAFFAKKLIIIFSLLTCYVSVVIFFLFKLSFWDKELLKDTIYWFCSLAMVLFFNASNITSSNYFVKVIRESVKWTIILDLLLNLYTFSLVTELILMPIIIMLVGTQAYAEVFAKEKQYEETNKILKNILSYIGIIFLLFALYKSITNYRVVFTIENLKSILLTPILTILLIPFIYLLAVGIHYESLFLRLRFMTSEGFVSKRVKYIVFKVAKVNLNRLMQINNKLNKADVYYTDDLEKYMRNLLE